MEFKGKHEKIAKGEHWPDWANYIVGLGDGWELFEDVKEGEAWMAEYRETHKNDFKPYVPKAEDESPKMGAIGFAA